MARSLTVRRALSLAVYLALVLLSASAHAAPSPDALIEEGLNLRRNGRPEEALEQFRRAHALAPSARPFGQMGLVETSLKRWVDAEGHLAMSLSSPDDAWVHKNRTFLDEALAVCRQHVGELVVSGPAGSEVFVAGNSVGTLPTVPAIHLAEGTVTVTASAPGFRPFERTATITPGKRSTLAIALTPVAPTPLPAPPAPPPKAATAPMPTVTAKPTLSPEARSGSWHTWGGITLAGVGAPAVAWGAVWVALRPLDERREGRASIQYRHGGLDPRWRRDRGHRGRRGHLFHRAVDQPEGGDRCRARIVLSPGAILSRFVRPSLFPRRRRRCRP